MKALKILQQLKKKKKYKTKKKKTNFENQQFTYVMYDLFIYLF